MTGQSSLLVNSAGALSNVKAQDVFKKNLSNAIMEPDSWAIGADGVLAPTPSGHGDIWTKERYDNTVRRTI